MFGELDFKRGAEIGVRTGKFSEELCTGSLDFVYIDGAHTFDYVMTDIIEWSKRVKKGGIISGDDYQQLRKGDVITAVNAYVQAHKIDVLNIMSNDDYSVPN